MRVDVREIYLKRLVTMERFCYGDYRYWFRNALMVLQGTSKTPTKEFLEGERLIMAFLSEFATEEGTPPMDLILYQMDMMRQTGRGAYKIKTPFVRKRFYLRDMQMMLGELEEAVNALVRVKVPDIRILNPELAV